jgi:predicted ATP-grasp superfamily ATP-dependent carboligase
MNNADLREENSILVFEYYTASGVDDPKIISEAVAMLDSLLDDLKDLNVYVLISKKFEFIVNNHKHSKPILINENLQKWLSNNVRNFNSCMFISSEEDMVLHEFTDLIEKNNVKLYTPNTFATLLSSDKFKTYNHFDGMIKQPKTLKFTIDEGFQWEIAIEQIIDFFNLGDSKLFSYGSNDTSDGTNETFKLIVKPVYGVD